MNCFILPVYSCQLLRGCYAFIMQKFHKDIVFFPCHIAEVKELILSLKHRKLRFSCHALQELAKESEAVIIGQFLKDYTLNFDDVFELAIDRGFIQKIGFRVNFGENDVVFVINRDKMVITLWLNDKKDTHKTLNVSLYCKPLCFNSL
jgi:hypothetical protein